MSILRSVSPIHVEYLQNMGVAASMSVSILGQNKLWGLFACHHYERTMSRSTSDRGRAVRPDVFPAGGESRTRKRERRRSARAEAASAAGHRDGRTKRHSSKASSRISTTIADLLTCDGIGVWVNDGATLERA